MDTLNPPEPPQVPRFTSTVRLLHSPSLPDDDRVRDTVQVPGPCHVQRRHQGSRFLPPQPTCFVAGVSRRTHNFSERNCVHFFLKNCWIGNIMIKMLNDRWHLKCDLRRRHILLKKFTLCRCRFRSDGSSGDVFRASSRRAMWRSCDQQRSWWASAFGWRRWVWLPNLGEGSEPPPPSRGASKGASKGRRGRGGEGLKGRRGASSDLRVIGLSPLHHTERGHHLPRLSMRAAFTGMHASRLDQLFACTLPQLVGRLQQRFSMPKQPQ